MASNSGYFLFIIISSYFLFTAETINTPLVDNSALLDKVILGYQGWFSCAGDSMLDLNILKNIMINLPFDRRVN